MYVGKQNASLEANSASQNKLCLAANANRLGGS